MLWWTLLSIFTGYTMDVTTNHPDRHRRAVLDFSSASPHYSTAAGINAGSLVTDDGLPVTTTAVPATPVTTQTAGYDMTTESYIGPEPVYHTTYQVCNLTAACLITNIHTT